MFNRESRLWNGCGTPELGDSGGVAVGVRAPTSLLKVRLLNLTKSGGAGMNRP